MDADGAMDVLLQAPFVLMLEASVPVESRRCSSNDLA